MEKELFRRVCGRFATGVTLVTVYDRDRPSGMTANAFTSVSLVPPLCLICVDKRARTLERVQSSGAFAVNVLSARQREVAVRFAGPHHEMVDPFFDIHYKIGVTGAPILEEALAWLECKVYREVEAGDHVIFVGEVVEMGLGPEEQPLLFYNGTLIDGIR